MSEALFLVLNTDFSSLNGGEVRLDHFNAIDLMLHREHVVIWWKRMNVNGNPSEYLGDDFYSGHLSLFSGSFFRIWDILNYSDKSDNWPQMLIFFTISSNLIETRGTKSTINLKLFLWLITKQQKPQTHSNEGRRLRSK